MNLSKRSEYALRALIDLGIARELGRPILQVSELALKEKLPIKFLEQILTQLRLAGYVETKRGKFGGYSLAKPAARIKLGAVIRVLDGPLAPIACVSQTAYHRCTCPDEAHCGLRMLMLDVRNAIARILDRSTLAQIVEITLRKMRRDKVPLPFARRSFGLTDLLPVATPKSADPRPTTDEHRPTRLVYNCARESGNAALWRRADRHSRFQGDSNRADRENQNREPPKQPFFRPTRQTGGTKTSQNVAPDHRRSFLSNRFLHYDLVFHQTIAWIAPRSCRRVSNPLAPNWEGRRPVSRTASPAATRH